MNLADGEDLPFLCFDTEDDSKELLSAGKSGFLKKVTQIAAITADGARFYCPGDVAAFLRWLEQRAAAGITWVYSLNIKYDLGNLFGDKLDVLDQTLVGGRVIRAKWGKVTFVDVFNIWPMSVKKLGQAFGLEKLETDSMSTDKEYVFRDVEIIRRAMLFAWQFVRHLGLDHLPATLGGLCVALWKEWEGENCHDSTALSREALFGGRVELFKHRNESKNVCWTDINSLYPSVMRGEFPGPLEPWPKKKKLPKFGIVNCTVKVPEMELTPLPFRRRDGMILYPWGRFTGTWTVAELNAALECGASIERVREVWGTNETMQPYREFVDKLYRVRAEAKTPAESLFYKLLMNNLYGRLGTTGVIGRTVWQNERNRNKGVPFGERVLVQYQMPLAEETNWAHAAYVTAYGRLELLKHMRLIGAPRMIYCDTDSAIFDCASRQAIPFETGGALGQMKLVGWERICETYAPKMYHCGDTWKAKGVPVRLAKEFILHGHVEYDMPFNMREAIAFYDRGNIKKLSVWRPITKERRSEYDKKELRGNRYFPCEIDSG